MCVAPFNEFRDRFIPNTSVTANDGLLLHTFTLQPRDTTFDHPACAYPLALGEKNKINMLDELTCINSINQVEDPMSTIKVYSKKHKAHMLVTLILGFISINQIEKRSYALFAGGNSKFGALHGWSCNCKDIKDRLISCKTCQNKLLKGINNKNCPKCYNWEISRSKHSKTLVNTLGGHVKKPFKLSIKMQQERMKETC